ncbi:MAG: hypothetical protein DRR19_16170 [Candidatus Parabeggiatoa sp. nov. 1]|nr:MAG: hypothetical protein DRR19_16170 [Gammaproteobacteria bacterium]
MPRKIRYETFKVWQTLKVFVKDKTFLDGYNDERACAQRFTIRMVGNKNPLPTLQARKKVFG